MKNEKLNLKAAATASLVSSQRSYDGLLIKGVYSAQCYDKDGNIKWEDTINNHVMTEGMNLLLETTLDGSGYTVTGPFMGLISSVGYGTTAVGDTAAQIGGTNDWDEAGPSFAPDYTGDRKTCVWDAAAAGVKALSAALAFTFSASGTVKGCFIVTGASASATHDDTNGVLLSAGVFTGGDKVVASTDVLNVSYDITLADT
jgi:hypothetical protein